MLGPMLVPEPPSVYKLPLFELLENLKSCRVVNAFYSFIFVTTVGLELFLFSQVRHNNES